MLKTTRMNNTNTIANYVMKITNIREQLATVGEEVKNEEVVPITLNGFSSS
jgi:hypothetical protein